MLWRWRWGSQSEPFNGIIIARFKLQPFIVTLATMGSLRGLLYMYSETPQYPVDPLFRSLLGGGFIGPLPVPALIFAVVLPVVWYYLNHTTSGRAVYAMGVNQEAVRLAGVNVPLHLITAYAACGFLAALAGVILASRLGIAQPSVGIGYELDAIAAVVIGGGILGGGGGTVIGVLGGVLALAMVDNVLNLFNVEFLLPAIPEGHDHPGRGAGQAKENLRERTGASSKGEGPPKHGRKTVKHIAKVIAASVLALATASALPAAAKEIKIGVVNLSLCCAYFVGMDKAVQEEASQFPNVKVISTDAKGDAAKLTSNVEDLLSQKVDGLIVSGAWIEAAPEALDAIKAAGVPVVMVDRLLKGGDYSSWVGPDNRAIGVGIGEYIAKRLNGKGTIVVIRGGPADNSIGADRTDGMLSVVKKTDIKVETAPDFGGWSVDGGFKQMDSLLTKVPHIDAVFCENNSMCQGAQKAINDAGRSERNVSCFGRRRKGHVEGDHDGRNKLRRHRPEQFRPDRPRRFLPADGHSRRRRSTAEDGVAVTDHHQRQRHQVLQS